MSREELISHWRTITRSSVWLWGQTCPRGESPHTCARTSLSLSPGSELSRAGLRSPCTLPHVLEGFSGRISQLTVHSGSRSYRRSRSTARGACPHSCPAPAPSALCWPGRRLPGGGVGGTRTLSCWNLAGDWTARTHVRIYTSSL